jgi:hypothetical protein
MRESKYFFFLTVKMISLSKVWQQIKGQDAKIQGVVSSINIELKYFFFTEELKYFLITPT